MLGLLARFRDEISDGYVLGPVRVAVGALLGWHALVAAEELAKIGYFGDVFHLPIIPDALVPSPRLYAVVLAARLCLAMMVAIGIWARPALGASALLGLWCLLADRNQFHHNRYSLFCYAFLLAFTPCDRSWRVTMGDVLVPRRGPFWAVRLAQVQVSIIYLASGGSKLLDPDWRDGLVLGDRIARHAHLAVKAGVPAKLVDVLARPDIASATAKLAIMTELVICVALWLGPTRVVALWWGLWFHVTIQATSKVEAFSVLALALYGVFVTPDHRARTLRFDPSRFWGRLAGTIVPALDWFARFAVEPWEPDEKGGHSVVVIRRDGRRATGVPAFAMMTRCLPLLFPLWAPVALLASFTKRGDLTTGG
ncbi:MAG: HTTM domain-containing protein [Labilithrix sp.]|nr:HTTM domain-containing protein [Labilithrix sp.]MCW5810147.1 HTTM domain-containing protein [Labilithrix sp.]